MIERTFDAAFFNRICNLSEVRPSLGGSGEIDVTPLLANPANYALRTDYGGFILVACGAGFYSVHTQFAAEGRGQHAVAAMRSGLDFMFTRTDCMRIHSHCPDDNPAALKLAQAGGAKPWFRGEHPQYGPGLTVEWDLMRWMVETPELEADGKLFHDLLEASKVDVGSLLAHHEDDPVHDRVVGAATRMCRRGQHRKGIIFYNLWADAAGYARIALVQDEPPVVDVVDAVLAIRDGEIEVLQCR